MIESEREIADRFVGDDCVSFLPTESYIGSSGLYIFLIDKGGSR